MLFNLLKVIQQHVPYLAPVFISLKQIALLSVEEFTVTSKVSHAHHKVGVPLQVINWHDIKLCDGVVLGNQKHHRNVNLVQVTVTRYVFVKLGGRSVAYRFCSD